MWAREMDPNSQSQACFFLISVFLICSLLEESGVREDGVVIREIRVF